MRNLIKRKEKEEKKRNRNKKWKMRKIGDKK